MEATQTFAILTRRFHIGGTTIRRYRALGSFGTALVRRMWLGMWLWMRLRMWLGMRRGRWFDRCFGGFHLAHFVGTNQGGTALLTTGTLIPTNMTGMAGLRAGHVGGSG